MTPFIRGSRGQSTVELAIVLPILLMLLIGIVDISLSLNAYLTVTNASREAATYAISHPSAAPSAIASIAASRIAPLHSVTVTTSYYNGSTFVPWPIGGLPSSSPSASQVPIQVDVSYPWSASTILIGQFFGGSGRTFHGTSTMVTTW